MTVRLVIPPLTVKNRPVRLFDHVRLIGRIRYMHWMEELIKCKTNNNKWHWYFNYKNIFIWSICTKVWSFKNWNKCQTFTLPWLPFGQCTIVENTHLTTTKIPCFDFCMNSSKASVTIHMEISEVTFTMNSCLHSRNTFVRTVELLNKTLWYNPYIFWHARHGFLYNQALGDWCKDNMSVLYPKREVIRPIKVFLFPVILP